MDEVLAKKKLLLLSLRFPVKMLSKAIDQVVANGVTAILNFAPDPLKVPDNVHVHYIDLTSELQTLIYFDGQ